MDNILKQYVETRELYDAAQDAYLSLLNGPQRKSDHSLFIKSKEAEAAWLEARDAYRLAVESDNKKEE